jgi:hypothetical protein
MTNFKKRPTVDETHAQGIEIEGVDELGNVVGMFRIKYLNPFADSTLLAVNRVDKRFQIKNTVNDKNPASTFKAIRVRFVELNLIGWSGLLDEDDKEIPFDRAVAHEFFEREENRQILLNLNTAASDATLFAEEDPEGVVKN